MVKIYLITLVLLLPIGVTHAFDVEAAYQQWLIVQDGPDESDLLMNLFLEEQMYGEYPQIVRQRFRDIASYDDAEILLQQLIDTEQQDKHISVHTLLKEFAGDNFVLLCEEYFYQATQYGIRNKLFNLITRQNSLSAFESATRALSVLQEQGLDNEAGSFLNYIVRFTQPEIRSAIIEGTESTVDIIKAASFVALRNYQGEDIALIIEQAAVAEPKQIAKQRSSEELDLEGHQQDYLFDVIQSTRAAFLVAQTHSMQPKSTQGRQMHSVAQTGIISLAPSDVTLAERYAPHLHISGAGVLGVNIKDSDYPYSDYIPIDVNGIISNAEQQINFYLASDINLWGMDFSAGSYPMGEGSLDLVGISVLRQAENYLDFSPVSMVDGYKSLLLTPSVYFRVFRDNSQENPIAIQYWFFYFFNDWAFFDHLGDWETMTVFLNDVTEPVEAIYSTHNEANRYSWNNINVSNKTHPKVFISNGGHGSYADSGATLYTIFSDNHMGDKEQLAFTAGDYSLLDLKEFEQSNDSWIWFSGRWGSQNSAPQGPIYRIDVPNIQLYSLALNPPFQSGGNCIARFATKTYGDEQHYGPWYWAEGYGLDGKSCKLTHTRGIL